ncbi:hypothetical protein DRA43_00610 [Micromonospora provocatoris]|nr:hypothetical protein DRA43_00610 [Micromonospora provocatoris]
MVSWKGFIIWASTGQLADAVLQAGVAFAGTAASAWRSGRRSASADNGEVPGSARRLPGQALGVEVLALPFLRQRDRGLDHLVQGGAHLGGVWVLIPA